MKHEQKITSIQFFALVFGGIIGIFTLSMPVEVIEAAGNDGWLSVILGGGLMFISWILITRLSLYYENQTIIEYLPRIYGKWIGNVLIGSIVLYLTGTISFLSRFFADTARLFLLPNTPRWAILLVFWLLIGYWAQFGIRVIAITMTIILIPTFINIGAFIFMPMDKIRFEHLLPVLGDGIEPVLEGTYRSLFFYFGAAVIPFIIPVLKEPKKAYKNLAAAYFLVILIFAFLNIILVARFSTNEVNNMVYPVVTLMRTLEFPGGFLERTDVIFFAIFIATALDDAALYLYLSVLSVVRWTGKNHYKYYVLSIIVLAYAGSLIHLDPAQMEMAFSYFGYFGLFFNLLVLPLGLIIIMVKRRRGAL